MVRFFLIVGLILITGGLYLNSFPGSFHYDDFPLLLENPVVTGQVFPFELFLGHFWGRPLALFSFHWDYQLFGDNPFFFHLVNCCLHLLAVVLLYALVRQYFGREYLAFTTALIFAIHPIQSQAVNYIWSRSILLMSVFALLCLLFCRRYPFLSLVLFQLAVWSRAEALLLVLPLILLVSGTRKPILLLTGVNLIVLTGYVCLRPPEEVAWNFSDPLSFWLAAPLALWKYLGLMFWPARLTVDHAHLTWSALATLAAATALVLLLLGIVRWRRQYPWILLGVSWILLFLGPSLLIPNSDLVNESRSYLAFAGFAFILANIIESSSLLDLGTVAQAKRANVFKRQDTGTSLAIWSWLLLLCLVYVPLTRSRNEVWQSDALLWAEAVRYSPAELRSRYNLGVALAREGKSEYANLAFEEALKLNPLDDLSYAALGYCAETRGATVEALGFYRAALSLNPENGYARLRISTIAKGDLYR